MKDFRGKEVASQLIRSVGSVAANIEEGYGRGYGKEYPRFLRISRGSAKNPEVGIQIKISFASRIDCSKNKNTGRNHRSNIKYYKDS